MSASIKLKPLIISILIALGAGFIGSVLGDSKAGYETLNQPSFAPPGIVFPIVWTILYILMGISAYLVYTAKAPKQQKHTALLFYAIQLVLNSVWTYIFFEKQWLLFGSFWIVLILIFVLITAGLFYKIKPISAYLLIPYILWLLFAAVLAYSIYLIN